jgi:SpoU rRNA methylase family enzyme
MHKYPAKIQLTILFVKELSKNKISILYSAATFLVNTEVTGNKEITGRN